MSEIEITKETQADEAHNFAAYQAVEKALRPYIDAAKTGDGALSRSAFFDHAHIVGSIGGEHYNMTADVFKGVVTDGGPSLEVQHHLRFTDYFVLYQKDGEWKISGKVYDSHSNN